MTRTSHFSAPAGIPCYALGFLAEDVVVYAGGGGAGRSGVTNALRAVRLDKPKRSVHTLAEHKLSRDEDAPMCLAVHAKHIATGINSDAQALAAGQNETLRTFEWTDGSDHAVESTEASNETPARYEIKPSRRAESLPIRDAEEYQKVAVFSPDGTLLLSGSTSGHFALQRFPSLDFVWSGVETATAVKAKAGGGVGDAETKADASSSSLSAAAAGAEAGTPQELLDADFNAEGTEAVLVSSSCIRVLSTSARASAAAASRRDGVDGDGEERHGATTKQTTAEAPKEAQAADDDGAPHHQGRRPAHVVQTIQNPAIGGGGSAKCSFRAARFGRGETRSRLFTLVNASDDGASKASGRRGGGRGAKARARKSFVTAWDADSWELIQTRKISDRPVTAFDVSADGKLLAYGSSDLSVGVLDARTLRPILRILDAHGFPPTSVRFSRSGQTLVSASADNTLRVIDVPVDARAREPGYAVLSLVLALALVLVAVYLQQSSLIGRAPYVPASPSS